MIRIRIPSVDDLAAEPHLTSLTILEIALELTIGSLRATHPAVQGHFHPGEDAEITMGRVIHNECGHLQEELSDYRRRVIGRIRRRNHDWPF
jgi:hypothetical protein